MSGARRTEIGVFLTLFGTALLLPTSTTAFASSPAPTPPTIATPLTSGGQILGSDQHPLSGAKVQLFADSASYERGRRALEEATPPRPVAGTVTDDGGFYDLGVPGPGLWHLRIEASGYRPADERLAVYLQHEENGSLHLGRGRAVRVRVVDPEGKPVAGALVVSTDGPPEGPQPRTRRGRRGGPRRRPEQIARTDETGAARFDAAEDRPLRLAAFAAPYAPSEVTESRGGSVELRLRRGRKRVLLARDRGGRAVPEALVRVGELGLPAGLTDESGRLTLAVPEGEPLTVLAEAPGPRWGRRELTATPAEPTTADREPTPAAVTLLDPLILAGRVIDAEDRSPVVGALVWEAGTPGAATISGRDGSFSLPLPPSFEEGALLLAVAPGHLRGFASVDDPVAAARRTSTLLLKPASAVTGVVVDSEGEPLAGALVRAFRRRGLDSEAGRARTTREGRFQLPALRPGGPYRVEARHEGFAPGSVEVPVLEPRRSLEGLRLVLQPGRTAFGRVVDAEEQSVEAAEVRLLPSAQANGFSGWLSFLRQSSSTPIHLTDRDGRFTVEDLGEGRVDLHVWAEGFADAVIPGVEIPPGSGAVDLGSIALEPTATIEGRTVDPDGTAIGGVLVRAGASWRFRRRGPDALRPNPETRTDAAGGFLLKGFRPGDEVELELFREGFARTRIGGIGVPPEEPLEIVLQPAARVSGTVIDEGGKPVAGAEVLPGHASSVDGGAVYIQPLGNREPAQTDEEGRFSFDDLPAGELSLQARAPGYQEGSLVHVELTAGREVGGIRLTLERGAVVEGRVTALDGTPVAEAWVHLLEGNSGRFGGQSDSTDGDGRFRLEGVPPGLRSFVADHRSYPRQVRDLEVQAGENRLDLVLEAGFEVGGRILGADGVGFAGASVTLDAVDSRAGGREISAADGGFTFRGISAGSYHLQAAASGYATATLPEPLRVEAADLTGLELQLLPGGRLRGRILGLTLDQLSAVEVIAFQEGPSTVFGRPDFEGEFLLEGLAPGDWTVRAQRSDGRSVSKEVTLPAAGEEVTVELEFPAGLTLGGRILQQGRPVAGVQVAIHGRRDETGGSGGYTATDPEGHFRFEDLSPGTYDLQVFSPQSGVIHDEEVRLESDREVEIEIPGGRISGRVLEAADDSPIEGVSLRLLEQGGGGEATVLAHRGRDGRGVSDATGAFRITHVAAGSYRLMALKDGYGRTEQPVLVEAGQELSGLEVRLQPTAAAELVVTVAAGQATPMRVRVLVTDASGQLLVSDDFILGEGGRLRLTSLPAGTWKALVVAPGLAAPPVEIRVPGPPVAVTLFPAAQVELSLPALAVEGGQVTLTILDATGRPLLAATPRQIPPGGSLTLPEFPPGAWTLRATAADGRTWAGEVTTTPGVTSQLVLE